MAAGAGCSDRSSEPGQAPARANSRPGGADTTSLLGSATTWPLKRYARFLPPAGGGDDERNGASWKVFESNEESGYLILTIVVSGHFFISQGRTVLIINELTDSCQSGDPKRNLGHLAVILKEDKLNVLEQGNSEALNLSSAVSHTNLSDVSLWSPVPGSCQKLVTIFKQALHNQAHIVFETVTDQIFSLGVHCNGCFVTDDNEGFSLIDSHKWLKVVRRADCLLFGAKSKNECRMFRVQFGGDSKEQMLEHCCNCVQKLAEYVPVQVTDEQSQMLYQSLNQLANGENQMKESEQNASILYTPDEPLPDSCTSLGERRSITQLAQSVLKSKYELPLVYRHSVWSAQELGPFIRLCLMDQNFPAFVEDVEKELKKLTEG